MLLYILKQFVVLLLHKKTTRRWYSGELNILKRQGKESIECHNICRTDRAFYFCVMRIRENSYYMILLSENDKIGGVRIEDTNTQEILKILLNTFDFDNKNEEGVEIRLSHVQEILIPDSSLDILPPSSNSYSITSGIVTGMTLEEVKDAIIKTLI